MQLSRLPLPALCLFNISAVLRVRLRWTKVCPIHLPVPVHAEDSLQQGEFGFFGGKTQTTIQMLARQRTPDQTLQWILSWIVICWNHNNLAYSFSGVGRFVQQRLHWHQSQDSTRLQPAFDGLMAGERGTQGCRVCVTASPLLAAFREAVLKMKCKQSQGDSL